MVDIGTYIDKLDRRTATIIVAAKDSKNKDMADFTCDGVNDDATIEDAFNALPAAGGKVLLLEGTFTFGSSLDILKSNVALEGSGPGTIIQGAIGVSYITVGNGATTLSNVKISNLRIDGTGQTAEHGIYFYGASGYTITNSVIENTWVKNCNTNGIYLYQYCNDNIIAGNISQSNGYHGIAVSYSNNNIVTGNNTQSNGRRGILLWYSNNNIVTGNISQSNGRMGILTSYNNNNIITGNILKDNSQSADNTYDDIYLEFSSYNIISNNIMIATATNKTRYAINEAGSSDYSIITGNYCSGQVTGKINLIGLNSFAANNIEV